MADSIMTQYVVGQKQSVVDELLLLNPYQIPMITLLGFSDSIKNTKHEWYEDTMFPFTSKATSAKLATDTAIVVADIAPFRVNHVIKVNDEMMLVTAINAGTKELTVTRGYASTTPAAIAQNDEVEVLFTEGIEGADARDARYKSRVPKNNYTQIFDDTIKISGSAAEIAQYGVNDEYEKEKQKKLSELALQLEKAVINGIPFSTGDKRMMGGIRQFITTNVISASGALTEDMIGDLGQMIYNAGGFKEGGRYSLLVPAKQKRLISKFSSSAIQLQRADGTRGTTIDRIVTDFGEFPITLCDNLKNNETMIVDANRASIKPLGSRSFGHTYLGKKGDYEEGQIVGEYTLEFKQESAHGRIVGLS